MDFSNLESYLRLLISQGFTTYEDANMAYRLVRLHGCSITGWPTQLSTFVLRVPTRTAVKPLDEYDLFTGTISRIGFTRRRVYEEMGLDEIKRKHPSLY